MQCLRLTTVVLSALLAGACAHGRPQATGEPAAAIAAQPLARVLDPLDNAASWKVVTPEGVRLSVHEDEGVTGRCLRLDYEFVTGGGYCIIQKDLPVALPANYELAFHVRGDGPDNNLEFKLLDKSGDNVWWVNRRAYEWPASWTRLSNKKRKLEFAWGPSAGAPLTEISKIEFAIASSSGGKGSVWLDDLVLRELVASEQTPSKPLAKAVSTDTNAQSTAGSAIDGVSDTVWSSGIESEPTLVIDFGSQREIGGVRVEWDPETLGFVRACEVSMSDDAIAWSPVSEPRPIQGPRSLFVTPDAESRYIRIRCIRGEFGRKSSRESPIGIKEVTALSPDFSATSNRMFEALAQESTPGKYPKYFRGEASYWTVIGEHSRASDAILSHEEAMINEEGQVEVGKRHFSIEPFVRPFGGSVLTWADATHAQSLIAPGIPVPVVTRTMESLSLETTAWTEQNYGVPWLMLRYRLKNISLAAHSGSLALAVRPFQVNPTYQWLNTPGGFAPIRSVTRMEHSDTERSGTTRGVRVSSGRLSRDVFAISGVSEVEFVQSDDADVVAAMQEGQPRGGSGSLSLTDTAGTLSVLFKYAYDLSPGAVHECVVAVPMHDSSSLPLLPVTPYANPELTQQSLDHAVRQWHEATSGTAITVPQADQWLSDTFAAQLAYILINRDGPALQPGSRSYERSWARDGSLTSAALLACGHTEEARAWIDWFGSHQFENGKIPCVVDSRGPDPVNEHDSHGEYIWAVANYYRHTHDAEFLKAHYPRVQKAVAYIESIRDERRTPEYKDDASPKRAMYGLVPESISHEGYSAKPMHSYWDCFFVLLGLKEASYVAEQMGDDQWAQAYAKLAAEFRMCLYDSMRRVFARSNIDYIPGCVELADFDSTSTTIALFPCDEQDHAPQVQLRNTFDRYWKFATGRMNGNPWEAYTPYELRHVGAFVRLGERDRAYELLNWFRQHQRPQGWHHWAEVVWNDPKTPKFIGDMPHTWVGSDYLNSVLSMFAYEHAGSVVCFAGVPRPWIDSGEAIGIRNMHTPHGVLTISMQRNGALISARAEGEVRMPEGGLVFRKPPRALGEDIVVTTLPAEVSWKME